jgi:hypothetical protein
MSLPSIQTARGWSGLTVVDSDDHPFGKIVHIYLDRDTELPEWASVAMPGRRRRTFVPLAGAARKGNRVVVAVSTAAMSDAPAIRPGRELSDDDATRLYGHYVGPSGDRKRGARRAPRRGLAARLKEVTAPPARSWQLGSGRPGAECRGPRGQTEGGCCCWPGWARRWRRPRSSPDAPEAAGRRASARRSARCWPRPGPPFPAAADSGRGPAGGHPPWRRPLFD